MALLVLAFTNWELEGSTSFGQRCTGRSSGSDITDCDRDTVAAYIRRFNLAGVRDHKRLTFKGLQALSPAQLFLGHCRA